MESVLLGLAATPAAVGTAGSLVERTLHAAAEPFAAALHALTSTVSADGRTTEAASILDLEGTLELLNDELATALESALTAAGVDLSEPIALQISNVDGQLEVVGQHPQKALVESALADNPELADKFSELVALKQLLAAADRLSDPDETKTIALGQAKQESVIALFTRNQDGAMLELIP